MIPTLVGFGVAYYIGERAGGSWPSILLAVMVAFGVGRALQVGSRALGVPEGWGRFGCAATAVVLHVVVRACALAAYLADDISFTTAIIVCATAVPIEFVFSMVWYFGDEEWRDHVQLEGMAADLLR